MQYHDSILLTLLGIQNRPQSLVFVNGTEDKYQVMWKLNAGSSCFADRSITWLQVVDEGR